MSLSMVWLLLSLIFKNKYICFVIQVPASAFPPIPLTVKLRNV